MRRVLIAGIAAVLMTGCGSGEQGFDFVDVSGQCEVDRPRIACTEDRQDLVIRGPEDVSAACMVDCEDVSNLVATSEGVAYTVGFSGVRSATSVYLSGVVGTDVELDGLEDLEFVEYGMDIDVTSLANLEGLRGLRRVGDAAIGQNAFPGEIYLSGGIRSIEGMEALETVRGLELERTDVTTTAGWPEGAMISRIFAARSNDKLVSLKGLRFGPEPFRIDIRHNKALRDIEGLKSITRLREGGTIIIENNPELSNCEAQEWIDSLEGPGRGLAVNNGPCD